MRMFFIKQNKKASTGINELHWYVRNKRLFQDVLLEKNESLQAGTSNAASHLAASFKCFITVV